MSQRSWRAVVLGGVVVAGAAFGVGYAVAPGAVPQWAETTTLTGAQVEVGEREHPGQQRTSATVTLSAERTLASPTSGVVRAAHCEPGQALVSGEPVLTVDERTVLALHTSAPLWRDLAAGMRGTDVTALQEELVRLGHAVPIDGVFRASTGLAVRELWRAAGGPQNLRTLPVTQVLWLEAPQLTVTACQVRVGERIGAGDPVLVTGGTLESLTVRTAGLPDDDLVVTAAGVEHETPLPPGGLVTDRAFLDAIATSPAFEQVRREGATEITVTTRLATPLRLTAVPPSALYDLTGSLGCILADGEPMPVEVIASELGQSLVATPAPVRTVTVRPGEPVPCR